MNSAALTVDPASVAQSCISNPSATFVPGSQSSGSGNPTSTGNNGSNGGSVSLVDSIKSLGLVMGISAIGALWTLFA